MADKATTGQVPMAPDVPTSDTRLPGIARDGSGSPSIDHDAPVTDVDITAARETVPGLHRPAAPRARHRRPLLAAGLLVVSGASLWAGASDFLNLSARAGALATTIPLWSAALAAGAALLAGAALAGIVGREASRNGSGSDKLMTFFAAAVATGVVATGMWKFFGDVLGIDNKLGRLALFSFFEITMLVSALRSRRFRLDQAARRADAPAGADDAGRRQLDVDGIAVWVAALLSGTFAATDQATAPGAALRLIAPMIAAWLWERGLAGELRQFTAKRRKITLTISVERFLVALRLAEPSGRDIADVARDRLLARLARTATRLDDLREAKAPGYRINRVTRSLRRQLERANERLGLATDEALRSALRANLATLYQGLSGLSREAVADLSPWASRSTPPAAPERDSEHPGGAAPERSGGPDRSGSEQGTGAGGPERRSASRSSAAEQQIKQGAPDRNRRSTESEQRSGAPKMTDSEAVAAMLAEHPEQDYEWGSREVHRLTGAGFGRIKKLLAMVAEHHARSGSERPTGAGRSGPVRSTAEQAGTERSTERTGTDS